ncbi:hypothetical protein NADFUDRAFT_82875, partial [Nadsonia fulvescens var. elongata DSM 6958]
MSSIFKRKNRKSSRNSQTASSPVPSADIKNFKAPNETGLSELPVALRVSEPKRIVSGSNNMDTNIPSMAGQSGFPSSEANPNGYRAPPSPAMNNWHGPSQNMNSPSQMGIQGPSQQPPRSRQTSDNGSLPSPQMNGSRMFESNPQSPVVNRTPLTPNTSANSQYPWSESQIKNLSPFPRYGHAANYIAARDGEIFVMGGLKGNNVFGDLWVIETDTLSGYLLETEGCPSPRVGHAALTLGNAFIVFGGDTKIQEDDILDDNLYLLNTSTLKWTVANPTGLRPQGRYGHTISTIGSRLYVFGGQLDDLFFNDLICFDLTSLRSAGCKWEIITPSNSITPPCRTNHSIVTYQDKLYLFGGTDGKLWYSDTYVFDPVDSTWTVLDCTGYIPAPCEGHSATIVDDIMYIFGGRNSKGEDLGVLSALRLSTQRWYTFQNMGPGPSARSGHSMSSFNDNKIIVMGGESPEDEINNQDSEAKTSTVYILDTTRIKYPPIKPQQSQQPQQPRQTQQPQNLQQLQQSHQQVQEGLQQQNEHLPQKSLPQSSQPFQQATSGLNIRSANAGTTIASSTVHVNPLSVQSTSTPPSLNPSLSMIRTPISNDGSVENSSRTIGGEELKDLALDSPVSQTYSGDLMSPALTVTDSIYTDDDTVPAPSESSSPHFKALQNKLNDSGSQFHNDDLDNRSISSDGYESAEDAYRSAISVPASNKYSSDRHGIEKGKKSDIKKYNGEGYGSSFDDSTRLTIEPNDRSTPALTEEQNNVLNDDAGKISPSWPSDVNLHSHIQGDDDITKTEVNINQSLASKEVVSPTESNLSSASLTNKSSNDLLEQLKATNAWYETELSVAKQNGYLPKTNSPVSIESIRRRSIRIAKDEGASMKERDILVEALKELKIELALVQANVKEQAEQASAKIADAEASRNRAYEETKSLREKLEGCKEQPQEKEFTSGHDKEISNNTREIRVDDSSIIADELNIKLMELEKTLRDQTEENFSLKTKLEKSDSENLRLKDIEAVTDNQIDVLKATNAALMTAQSKISSDEAHISALRQELSESKIQLKNYELKVEDYEKDLASLNDNLEHHKQLSTESSNAMTAGISKITALWGANKAFSFDSTFSRSIDESSEPQGLNQNESLWSNHPEFLQLKQKTENLFQANEANKKASESAENELKIKLLELTQVKKLLLSTEAKFASLEETSKSRSIDDDNKLKMRNEELNTLSEKLNQAESDSIESTKKYEAHIEDITKRYEQLENVYNETRQSIKVNDRALRVTKDELTKFRDLNSKLQAELYELKLSIDSDDEEEELNHQDSRARSSDTRTVSASTTNGDDSTDAGNSTLGSIQSYSNSTPRTHNLNTHHLELQLRDLRAEVIILQDERDKLKDESIELKKKLIAMSEDLKTSQERIEILLHD